MNGKRAPFTFETVPAITDTTKLGTPELIIEKQRIIVALGSTSLRLRLHDDSNLKLWTGVWRSKERSLDTVTAHLDAGEGLRRFEFIEAPYHSAVHIVDDATKTRPDYCTIHAHEDVAELNVIIPAATNDLDYKVTDGSSELHVEEPTIFWFEPGVPHCAIADVGGGLFFVARIPVR